MSDPINPNHYKANPFFECIELTERYGFNEGNCIKYMFRLYGKHKPLEDARKAQWYANRAIGEHDSDFKTMATTRRTDPDMEAVNMLHQLELADWQNAAPFWKALSDCELNHGKASAVRDAVDAIVARLAAEES